MQSRRLRPAAWLVALLLLAPGAMASAFGAPAVKPAARPNPATCNRAAFRMVVDVGHTAEVPGALSARGVAEYDFDLRLSKQIEKDLLAAGFDKAFLMITAEAPTAGLFKRVARASALKADLLLSIHHDAVPEQLLETWQFEGQEHHFNDRFPGHSIFISNDNADRAGSLAFAKLLGNALKTRGLKYTPHYTEKFMGNRRRELVDAQAGVYRYDQLIVLKDTHMPAVLLEAGSIVNRDEELLLATPEHQALISAAVVEAADAFCAARKRRSKPPTAERKP